MDIHDLAPTSHAPLTERILYEVKKVVVGQDPFLERVLVAILAQGHLLFGLGHRLGLGLGVGHLVLVFHAHGLQAVVQGLGELLHFGLRGLALGEHQHQGLAVDVAELR